MRIEGAIWLVLLLPHGAAQDEPEVRSVSLAPSPYTHW